MKYLALLVFVVSTSVYAKPQTSCFKVTGMTCGSCSNAIKTSVGKLDGITKVDASTPKGEAQVIFDSNKADTKKIMKTIESLGYEATLKNCKKDKKTSS